MCLRGCVACSVSACRACNDIGNDVLLFSLTNQLSHILYSRL